MTFFQRLQRLQAKLRSAPFASLTLVLVLLSSTYWLLLASDRYVSQARLLVQNASLQATPSMDLGSLLGAAGSSVNRGDQLLLREHLRSPDMARRLDALLGLRAHYGNQGDWFSRLWGGAQASDERFHSYYLRRVEVEFDEFSGVLVVNAQAFTPQMAQRMAQALVEQGERFMNGMAHEIAQEQVDFLQAQVQQLHGKVQHSRAALLAFQDKEGMISPEAAAQVVATIVASLQGQLADLQAQRTAMQAYLVDAHPNLVLMHQRIEALEKQIAQEKAKLAAPGGRTLNRTAEAFAQLQLQAQFDLDMYKTALTALEQGRLESMRTLKKVSVLQQPNLPQDALQPQRLYTSLVWLCVIALLAGVLHLLRAVLMDHRD